MKEIALILCVLMTKGAYASGCGGGAWRTIEQTSLPSQQITPYLTKTEVDVVSNFASVRWSTFSPITPEGKYTVFSSNQFDLEKTNLSDLVLKLNDQNAKFLASVERTVMYNDQYDDCSDIPENTKETAIRRTFLIILSDKKRIELQSVNITYDPPLDRSIAHASSKQHFCLRALRGTLAPDF